METKFIKIDTPMYHIDFVLHSKFTVVFGDSGIGKTTFAENAPLVAEQHPELHVVSLNGSSDIDDLFLTIAKYNDHVFVIDEPDVRKLRHTGRFVKLCRKPCYFIFLCRDNLFDLNYSYRDCYTMIYTDGVYRLSRIYPDYEILPQSTSYLVEDSGLGFDYYTKELTHSVRSAFGKDSVLQHLKHNDCLIADGASIGNLMHDITAVTTDLFLPESFEFLLINHFRPDLTFDYFRDCPVRVGNYERYFEEVIANLAHESNTKYDKGMPLHDLQNINLLNSLYKTIYIKWLTQGADLNRYLNIWTSVPNDFTDIPELIFLVTKLIQEGY